MFGPPGLPKHPERGERKRYPRHHQRQPRAHLSPEFLSPYADDEAANRPVLLHQLSDATKTDDDVLLHDYRASAALAESAVLCQTLGPTLEQQNLDDVEKLLGERFDGELDALQALTERIKTSPSTDLEDTIRTLYRIQCRKEFVVEPIQRFCGFGGHRKPMQRFF